jgi:hypothetical protein
MQVWARHISGVPIFEDCGEMEDGGQVWISKQAILDGLVLWGGVRPGPCAGVHIDLKEEDGYIDETVIVCERGDIVIGCCGAMRQDDG